MIWLYNNNKKNIFVTIIFHTLININDILFPINGSFYDPAITGMIILLIAITIIFFYGSKTLKKVDSNLKIGSGY